MTTVGVMTGLGEKPTGVAIGGGDRSPSDEGEGPLLRLDEPTSTCIARALGAVGPTELEAGSDLGATPQTDARLEVGDAARNAFQEVVRGRRTDLLQMFLEPVDQAGYLRSAAGPYGRATEGTAIAEPQRQRHGQILLRKLSTRSTAIERSTVIPFERTEATRSRTSNSEEGGREGPLAVHGFHPSGKAHS